MSIERCIIGDLTLDSGVVLPEAFLSYTTYGTYDPINPNTVIVFHALTGTANASEWWSGIIGEGKSINPQDHFVICFNSLGSCYGSIGPECPDASGKKYGKNFPKITIRDIARSQLLALEQLGIDHAVLGIGGSMGAMVLLELALLKPDLFDSIISIACGALHTAWRLAFSSVIRKTIEAFGNDDASYVNGMKLARQIAMTSYRCDAEFESRFARLQRNEKFEVENYLEHQGGKIAARFSPYSYLRLTEAMESYDLCAGRDRDLSNTLSAISSEVLCIGIDSDILYPEAEIKALASSFPSATYKTLHALHGHDSFLVDEQELATLIIDHIPTPTIALQLEEVAA
ncbi:MAG TPA: homoserine O-acetyltransferase [Candidatus Kapabacteria bacterium]|nr:homoserine O-acetyltransferase [Candidatus Kapabacteria bacterium]